MRGKRISDKDAKRICTLLMRPGWNMDRVSAELGISRATVYRVTGGKKALLTELERWARAAAKNSSSGKPLRGPDQE